MTPAIQEHLVRGLITLAIYTAYVFYARFVKLKLPPPKGAAPLLSYFAGDILFIVALVPRAADHLLTIFK